ncbi:MAG: hypothetical protein L6R40_000491 [Gallowayella cf. fulva]|nr:MAG: hypothetical protein L6R40_000491 [Xanthomendoza cf. fulva]
MPQRTVSYRPQTSKQAKRAYQKAGATPRISALEQRRIERAAELQERAARIRAHNFRAKENKRRKAEKDEKEREVRKRMGIEEPVKNDVGPSQLRLGAFVIVGKKPKEEERCSPLSPYEDILVEDPAVECLDTGPAVPETALKPPIKSDHPPPRQENEAIFSPSKTPSVAPICTPPRKTVEKETIPLSHFMPPPSRPPLKKLSSNSVVRPSICPPRSIPTSAVQTDWDLFLDSNTQVEREISEPQAKPHVPSTLYSVPVPQTAVEPRSMEPTDILTGISTQDLQYCSSPPPLPSLPSAPTEDVDDGDEDFLGGLQDEDLGCLTQAAVSGSCKIFGTALMRHLPLPQQAQKQNQVQSIETGRQVSWPPFVDSRRHNEVRSTSQSSGLRVNGRMNDTAVLNPTDEFDDCEFSSQELRDLVL